MNTMARMPTRGTRPEREILAAVRRVQGGALVQVANLPGTPDLVIPERKLAIFAMGCFWHHHIGCAMARVPETSFDWRAKFERNRRRDFQVRAALTALGYRVMWAWECALRGPDALSQTELDAALVGFIEGTEPFTEIVGDRVRRRRGLQVA